MLNTDEVKKINTLYQDIDKKDVEIASLQNQLAVNNQTIEILNRTIENNKVLVEGLTQKADIIISMLNSQPQLKTSSKSVGKTK